MIIRRILSDGYRYPHGFCDQAIRRVGSRSAEVCLRGSAYTRGGESVGRPRLRKQSRKVRTPQGGTVVTPTRGDPRESATESRPPAFGSVKGETVV